MNRVDPLDDLLDEVQPPPPPADFAAKIAANAAVHPQSSLARDTWNRRVTGAPHRTLATFVAVTLLVASAVAVAIGSGQGLEALRKVPLIAPAIERVAPRHPPVADLAEHRPPTMPSAPASAPAAPAVSGPLPMSDRQLRTPPRQIVRHRLEPASRAVRQRVHRTIPERRAAGRPVPPLRKRLRDARSAAVAGRTGMPGPEQTEAAPFPPEWQDAPAFPSFEEWRAARRERMRRYLQSLSPEERRQFREESREDRERAPNPGPP